MSFKLFGVLPGSIGLRGKVIPVAEGEPHGAGKAGQQDTVKVLFEPPVLSLADRLYLRIGENLSSTCRPCTLKQQGLSWLIMLLVTAVRICCKCSTTQAVYPRRKRVCYHSYFDFHLCSN